MWFPNHLRVEFQQLGDLGDLGDGEELVHERNRTHHGGGSTPVQRSSQRAGQPPAGRN